MNVNMNSFGFQKPLLPLAQPAKKYNADKIDRKVEQAASNTIQLALLNGANGFTINGINGNDQVGLAITSADINADGIDDLITSAPSTFSNGIYAIFGTKNPFDAIFNLNTLNGQNGFTINNGNTVIGSGFRLAHGDINGDGIQDFVYLGSLNSAVIFGSNQGFPAAINFFTQGPNGNNGFLITDARFNKGLAVGDLNGDGVDDIFLSGTTGSNFAGSVFAIFGKKTAFPASFSVLNLNGLNGFVAIGNADDEAGTSVASGDVNGDGITDMVIGAPGIAATYTLYGSNSTFPSIVNLPNLNGSNGFIALGLTSFDKTGTAVAVGDINNDGKFDLLVGAPSGGNNAGAVYAVLGKGVNFPSALNISSVVDGVNGFITQGIDPLDLTGTSVTTADVNADGIQDAIIGAPKAGPGKAYVVFGKKTGFSATVDLGTLSVDDGFTVVGINLGDQTGIDVASGDINGDGKKDLLIGADFGGPLLPNNQKPGSLHVLFGGEKIGKPNDITSSATRLEPPFAHIKHVVDTASIAMGVFSPNSLKQAYEKLSIGDHLPNQAKIKENFLPAAYCLTIGAFAIALLYSLYSNKKENKAEQNKVLKTGTVQLMKEKLNKELILFKDIFKSLPKSANINSYTKQSLEEDILEFETAINFISGYTTRMELNAALNTKRNLENRLVPLMMQNKIV